MPTEPHDDGDKISGRAEKTAGIASQSCDLRDIMDPFSVTLGVVALTGTLLTAASKVDAFHSSYQKAGKDNHHIQDQKKQLQFNQTLLEELKSNLPSSVQNGLKSSLADLEAALPSEHYLGKQREKLRWAAFGGKQKAQDKIARLKEIESSAILTLLLTTMNKWSVSSYSRRTFRIIGARADSLLVERSPML